MGVNASKVTIFYFSQRFWCRSSNAYSLFHDRIIFLKEREVAGSSWHFRALFLVEVGVLGVRGK